MCFGLHAFLKTDSWTSDKERLDYACILISTKSLEVINLLENVMVDGKVFALNFVEDWGLGLGNGACLLYENLNSNSVISNQHM